MDGLRRLILLFDHHASRQQPLCTGIAVLFLLLWVPVFHDIADCSSPVATPTSSSTTSNEACGQCYHHVPPVLSSRLGWQPALTTKVTETALAIHAFRAAPLLRPPK